MSNYIDLSLEELFDLLSKNTNKLSEIFKTGEYGSAEYLECRDTIREIQRIILLKKKLQSKSPALPNDDTDSYQAILPASPLSVNSTEDDRNASADYQ